MSNKQFLCFTIYFTELFKGVNRRLQNVKLEYDVEWRLQLLHYKVYYISNMFIFYVSFIAKYVFFTLVKSRGEPG